MSTSIWTGAVSWDWADPDNWSPASVPSASSDVVISTGDTVASASIGTVNSITNSSDLLFESAGTNTVTTFVDDTNWILLDASRGEGGTNLNIGGTLTNSGGLTIGNATLSASDDVTAASLDNTGDINLHGSGANQALLDVAGSAGFGSAGVLSGTVGLFGDSAIEFASGQISTIATGASLFFAGNSAFIEDSRALGSNSALTGLSNIAGSLFLVDGAAVSTVGSLVNDGNVYLDNGVNGGDGGSSMTVAGTLSNSGAGVLLIGNGALSAPDTVTAASLNNTGLIFLNGSSAGQALLDVTASSAGFGAMGVLSGHVHLRRDSAIEFASGQITSLAAGAHLGLVGSEAFIEDSTALGSNSALTGLASIGHEALFALHDGAAVSTTGSLVNDGHIRLDTGGGDGGSSLTAGGTLTNSGTLFIGNYGLSASDSVTAKSFVNSGTVDLIGNGTNLAALDVSGATTNKGSISTTSDTEEFAGAVRGAGSFSLDDAHLRFDSSVSAGQTITETGVDHLTLKHAQSFAGTISGFGTGDTIDAANFLLSGTTFNFAENTAGTGGTLALHDTSLTANILMTGHYSNSDFTLAPDHGTGTLVKFV